MTRTTRTALRLESLEARDVPATFTVTSAADSGPGTLRAELVVAAPGDTVVFDPGLAGQTIALTAGQITLSKDVTIAGPGASVLSVSGGGASRVFEVPNGVTATISGLTVRDGLTQDRFGGGILNHGTLTLTGDEIRDNEAPNGGRGGGVFSDGLLFAVNCFIHDNKVSSFSSAVGVGAGLFTNGTAGLTGCTISNNTGVGDGNASQNQGNTFGGGIFNDTNGVLTLSNCTLTGNKVENGNGSAFGGALQNNGTATIRNSTIAFNVSESDGGGIHAIFSSTLQLFDTIVAGNTASFGPDIDGPVTSLGHNLIGNPSLTTGLIASDVQNVILNGNLLADNGGPVPTISLRSDSPAVNAGDPTGVPATDQRGFKRVVDGAIDIGAFEFQPSAVTVALSSSANPVAATAPVTFTATVTGVAAGSNAPTGGVLFLIDGQPRGTAPVHNGTASFTTSSLSLGAHAVQVQYAGDVNFDGGSATLVPDEQVNPALPPPLPPAPPPASPPPPTSPAPPLPLPLPPVVSPALAAPTAPSPTPQVTDLFAVATGPGAPVQVKVFNADASRRFTLRPFDGFAGGATVSTGDVNGDGIQDIVVGAGAGAPGGHVKVFSGATGAELHSFLSFPGFSGGVFVGTGDVNGDGRADIVVGAGPGAGPHVKVFDGVTGAAIRSFFAHDPAFQGGVSVRGGDLNGDGFADIVVGAGPGAPPHVKIFDGATLNELASFLAGDPTSRSGVLVGVGNLVVGSRLEVVGSVNGSIRVFGFTPSGNSLIPYIEQDNVTPFGPGINAAPAFIQLDNGVGALLVGATLPDGTSKTVDYGDGIAPHVKILSATSNTVVSSFLAFDKFLGGVRVG